jgi:hypothetical protein
MCNCKQPLIAVSIVFTYVTFAAYLFAAMQLLTALAPSAIGAAPQLPRQHTVPPCSNEQGAHPMNAVRTATCLPHGTARRGWCAALIVITWQGHQPSPCPASPRAGRSFTSDCHSGQHRLELGGHPNIVGDLRSQAPPIPTTSLGQVDRGTGGRLNGCPEVQQHAGTVKKHSVTVPLSAASCCVQACMSICACTCCYGTCAASAAGNLMRLYTPLQLTCLLPSTRWQPLVQVP